MLQILRVNKFEWIEDTSLFNEDFVKKESGEWHFLKVDIRYPENLHELHNYLPFLPERMKLGKVEKLVNNLHDINECIIRIRNSKQPLNHGLIF